MSEASANPPRTIVILGPTAGGKSELAVMLAERIGAATGVVGELLGADSMQVYRRMDAGTAKPTTEQRARAAHHLIDIVEPTERFTVAHWLARAEATIASLRQRGVTPIVVGGTNLYIKALLEGLFEGPAIDEALRTRLHATPLDELRRRLTEIDPLAASRIHANDRRRTIRALEVFEQTGRRISELQTQWEGEPGFGVRGSGFGTETNPEHGSAPPFTSISHSNPKPPNVEPEPRTPNPEPSSFTLLGLHWPAELINPRINARVKEMFHPHACGLTHESLPDETARLESANLLGFQARKALGYQQVLEHLADPKNISLDDAFEQTKILTRRFAKTQRTWLKRFRNVHWLQAATMSADQLADAAIGIVKTSK